MRTALVFSPNRYATITAQIKITDCQNARKLILSYYQYKSFVISSCKLQVCCVRGNITKTEEENWWYATITKKPKKKNDDGYLYSVLYHYQPSMTTSGGVGEKKNVPSSQKKEEETITTNSTKRSLKKKNLNGRRSIRSCRYDRIRSYLDGCPERIKIRNNIQSTIRIYPKKVMMMIMKTTKRKIIGKGKKSSNHDDDDKNAEDIDISNNPPWRKEGHLFFGRQILWKFYGNFIIVYRHDNQFR